ANAAVSIVPWLVMVAVIWQVVPAIGFAGSCRLVTDRSGCVDGLTVACCDIWLLFSLYSVICWLASAITDRLCAPLVRVDQLKVTSVDAPAASPVRFIFAI